MRYRPFGRTGLQVSELVFGGGWVGGILIHQDDATKRAAIERALEAGINWIDTAPSYGDGKSEARARLAARGGRGPALPVDQGAARSVAGWTTSPGQVEASLEAEPEAAALRLGRAVPAAQPDRARRPWIS